MRRRFKPGDTAWLITEEKTIYGFFVQGVEVHIGEKENVFCLDLMGESHNQDELFKTFELALSGFVPF